ncbi:hypothetical protein [Candidatus Harpocratesius sp.]
MYKSRKIGNTEDLKEQLYLPSFIRLKYFFSKFQIDENIFNNIFNLYNKFLQGINKSETRERLDEIDFEKRENPQIYYQLRDYGRKIHDNIKNIFEQESVKEHIFDIFL